MTRTVSLLALVALVVMSGCVGFITGDSAFSASSEPAIVPDSDLPETGYEAGETQSQRLNRTVEVAGQERQVNLTLWTSMYTKTPENATSVEGAARNSSSVALVSLPGIEIAGQSLNPLDIVSTDVLFELADRGAGSVEREKIGTAEYTMLESNTTADVYRVQKEGGDGNNTAIIEMASVQHEGDLIVALATYPEGAGENANVGTLLRNIEHPAERP